PKSAAPAVTRETSHEINLRNSAGCPQTKQPHLPTNCNANSSSPAKRHSQPGKSSSAIFATEVLKLIRRAEITLSLPPISTLTAKSNAFCALPSQNMDGCLKKPPTTLTGL